MILSVEFNTGAEYAAWFRDHRDTQLLSVVHQFADGEWHTLVMYISEIAVSI